MKTVILLYLLIISFAQEIDVCIEAIDDLSTYYEEYRVRVDACLLECLEDKEYCSTLDFSVDGINSDCEYHMRRVIREMNRELTVCQRDCNRDLPGCILDPAICTHCVEDGEYMSLYDSWYLL